MPELQTVALCLFGLPFLLWLGIILFHNLLSLLTFLRLLRTLGARAAGLRWGLLRLSFLQNGPKHEEDGMRYDFSLYKRELDERSIPLSELKGPSWTKPRPGLFEFDFFHQSTRCPVVDGRSRS